MIRKRVRRDGKFGCVYKTVKYNASLERVRLRASARR